MVKPGLEREEIQRERLGEPKNLSLEFSEFVGTASSGFNLDHE